MQIPTFTLAAAGVIVIASVTLNTSHKRSQSSKHRRNSGNWGSLSSTGSGGSGGSGSSGGNGGSGSGASSVNFNRAMQFPSPEFQPSLSSARASPPRQPPYLSRNNARHTRVHSLNRNVPHTPSATVSMAEVLHSRNPFHGSPATRVSRAGVQPAGAPTKGGTRRCMILCKPYPIAPHHRADANCFSRPISIPISLRDKFLRRCAPENRCPQTSRPEPLP